MAQTSSSAKIPQDKPAPSLTTGGQLPLLSYFGYGAGDMANTMVFSLVLSFLPLYFTDVAGISPAMVGTIFLVMRFIDGFTDIAAGSVVDRTQSKWGKFRPFILIFSVPLVVSAVLLFSMPASMRGTDAAFWWGVGFYFLVGSVFYTLVNIPYGSLAAAMTQQSNERSRLATFRSVGSTIMQIALAFLIAPMAQKHKGDPDALQSSFTMIVVILGIIAIVFYIFTVMTAKERVYRTVEQVNFKDAFKVILKNDALIKLCIVSVVVLTGSFGMMGMALYFNRDVLGNAGFQGWSTFMLSLPVLIFGGLIPALVKRIGKRGIFSGAAAIAGIGSVMLYFAPEGAYIYAAIAYFILGMSNIVNLIVWNLEADTIEYGELKGGLRTEGTTYAFFSFARKLAQSLGGFLGLQIIGWFNYDGTLAQQTDETIHGIRLATALIPAILFFVGAALIWWFPINEKRHASIVEELDVRHAAFAKAGISESLKRSDPQGTEGKEMPYPTDTQANRILGSEESRINIVDPTSKSKD